MRQLKEHNCSSSLNKKILIDRRCRLIKLCSKLKSFALVEFLEKKRLFIVFYSPPFIQ